MESLYNDTPDIKTSDDLLRFFQAAVEYRRQHKEESEKIARFVFDATHQAKLNIPLTSSLERIRDEFGALRRRVCPRMMV